MKLFNFLASVVLLASCASIKKEMAEAPKETASPRYLFSWGYQKAKVPKKVIRKEFKRLSISHYYHNENGATPDVVLVGRPAEKFGKDLPNLFALQIYQSMTDPRVKLDPVLKKGEYFDDRSGSVEAVPFANVTEGDFGVSKAYWMRATMLNWGKGKSVFFVAQVKSGAENFLKSLYDHLKKSQNVFGTCSDAFVVFVGSEYSVSFLHFENDQAFEKCVFSAQGQAQIDDLKKFMDVSLVTEIHEATQGEVNAGEAVKVITK